MFQNLIFYVLIYVFIKLFKAYTFKVVFIFINDKQ